MEERLDKTFFKKQSVKEADRNVVYWRTKSMSERLQAAYHLSLRVYGYSPDNPPRMDKSFFTIRKRIFTTF